MATTSTSSLRLAGSNNAPGAMLAAPSVPKRMFAIVCFPGPQRPRPSALRHVARNPFAHYGSDLRAFVGGRSVEALIGSIIQAASRQRLETLHHLANHVGAPLASALYRRPLVASNLAGAFPEATDAHRQALAAGFYQAFAQVCVEVLRVRHMSPAELRQRVNFTGTAPLNDGGLLLMAHHGNLVWAVSALAGELEAPVSVVYKLPHLAAMRELLQAIAKRFNVDPVPVKELRQRLVATRQQTRVWTLVADQRPGEGCHDTRLCGRRTAFHLGRSASPER